MRNMKDSLLKVNKRNPFEKITGIIGQELKRDLMKLVKVDKAYSEMHRKSKPVPVRPGLALGVITLQVLPRPTLLSTIFPYTAVYVGFRSDLKFMYDTMIVFIIIQRGLSFTRVSRSVKTWHVHPDLTSKYPPHKCSCHSTPVQTICHTKYPLEAQRVLSPAGTKHIPLRGPHPP